MNKVVFGLTFACPVICSQWEPWRTQATASTALYTLAAILAAQGPTFWLPYKVQIDTQWTLLFMGYNRKQTVRHLLLW